VHTSYRSGCGSISQSLGRTATTLRYVLNSFLLYIFYVNYLINNLKFNLQPRPFDDNDNASQPLLGYRWSRITHLTSTVEARYMMYSNVFDCITSGQVRQHLFTCQIFSNINMCQKFVGYLAAIRDRHDPWYGSQRYLQARPGPMDGCCPSYLLLRSILCTSKLYTIHLCVLCLNTNLSANNINVSFVLFTG
jgi:hypothetical protein